jgi:hypothetical protein
MCSTGEGRGLVQHGPAHQGGRHRHQPDDVRLHAQPRACHHRGGGKHAARAARESLPLARHRPLQCRRANAHTGIIPSCTADVLPGSAAPSSCLLLCYAAPISGNIVECTSTCSIGAPARSCRRTQPQAAVMQSQGMGVVQPSSSGLHQRACHNDTHNGTHMWACAMLPQPKEIGLPITAYYAVDDVKEVGGAGGSVGWAEAACMQKTGGASRSTAIRSSSSRHCRKLHGGAMLLQ